MAKAVFCIAHSEAQAITIVERLKAAGFSSNDISVLLLTKQAQGTLRTNSTPKRQKARPRAPAPGAY